MPETLISQSTVLPMLADPAGYVACQWDLTRDADQRAYWLGLFRRHFPTLLDEGLKVLASQNVEPTQAQQRADQANKEYMAYLDDLEANPQRVERLDVLMLCDERERILRQAGFDDPYHLAKQRETDAAIKLLPALLTELDAMPWDQRALALIRGVFAGNIFDLGAAETVALFRDKPVDFHHTREQLKPRPWLVDDLDAWLDWLERQPGPEALSLSDRAVLLFVDNAGPDIALGMMPFARDFLMRGAKVIVATNSTPSLNDVTQAELEALIGRIAEFDPVVRDAWDKGRLECLGDGNGLPLIDFTKLSPEFVAAVEAEPIDLVVIEGMGRSIESNFDAAFTCNVLKVAMVKDQGVADALGGEVYDLVLRFEPGV